MKIEIEQQEHAAVLKLNGRLDVVWAEHVVARAHELLRAGRHVLQIDASGLTYLSSAGIRALILIGREVAAVQGGFHVIRPSEFVENALRMSGLDSLLVSDAKAELGRVIPPAGERPASFQIEAPAGLAMQGYRLAANVPIPLHLLARWTPWAHVRESDIRKIGFPAGTIGLGIGAAGNDADEARSRFGEFLAAAGCMVVQPADSLQHRPDYVTQTGGYLPELHAIQCLMAEGEFSSLIRFRPDGAGGQLLLSDLIAAVLDATESDAAAWVMLAEVEGLVGSALFRSPAQMAAGDDPGAFPEIRDWLGYCGERVHAGHSALVVGYAARPNAPEALAEVLVSLPSRPEVLAHAHAAVFSYRPLPEGSISMAEPVRALFETREPLDLLHLLEDDRPLVGLGQSAFLRGACWCAPLRLADRGPP